MFHSTLLFHSLSVLTSLVFIVFVYHQKYVIYNRKLALCRTDNTNTNTYVYLLANVYIFVTQLYLIVPDILPFALFRSK